MSVCIALRDDYDSIQLRRLAKRCRDPRQVRRLLALAAAYDGMSRAEAAKVGGMDRAGEVFLNASMTRSSCLGCCGRALICEKDSAASRSEIVRSL